MERAELDAVNTKRRKEQEKLKSDYRSLLLQRLKEQEVRFFLTFTFLYLFETKILVRRQLEKIIGYSR